MQIVYDAAKDTVNLAKHGVSLALAAEIEWESAVVRPDVRRRYGEQRMAAIGYIGCVCTAQSSWTGRRFDESSACVRPTSER